MEPLSYSCDLIISSIRPFDLFFVLNFMNSILVMIPCHKASNGRSAVRDMRKESFKDTFLKWTNFQRKNL